MDFVKVDQSAVSEEVIEACMGTGLRPGEAQAYTNKFHQSSVPAVAGNTFDFKDTLKAHGARWNAAGSCWVFDSYEARDKAILACRKGAA